MTEASQCVQRRAGHGPAPVIIAHVVTVKLANGRGLPFGRQIGNISPCLDRVRAGGAKSRTWASLGRGEMVVELLAFPKPAIDRIRSDEAASVT